jgi:hypothetical protein
LNTRGWQQMAVPTGPPALAPFSIVISAVL